MPTAAELPWHLIAALPVDGGAYLSPTMITLRSTASVVAFFVIRHKKKHAQPDNLPTIPSQTSKAGGKQVNAPNNSRGYRIGQWFKKFGKEIKHYWGTLWRNEEESKKWSLDLQYPRPGDVWFRPIRPDFDPYLDSNDLLQPQVSEEQLAIYAKQAAELYRILGKGKGRNRGEIPSRERVKFDCWRRQDRCSGRNLIWNYIAANDGSVPDGLDKCPGYVRLLLDHGCAITANGTVCLGFHPTDDINFVRYALPNNTWNGLGNPYTFRQPVNLTNHPGDATKTTDMYTIDIGNGTMINMGIDRAVANNDVNMTAFAEGILPDGVELYGPDWKSEYDVDDEDDSNMLIKRDEIEGSTRYKSRPFDLSQHKLSREEVMSIFGKQKQVPFGVNSTSRLESEPTLGRLGHAVTVSACTTLLVFSVAILGMMIWRKKKGGRRNMLCAGLLDNDAEGIDMKSYTDA